MEKAYLATQAAISGVIAFISAKLGILFPLFCMLAIMFVIDYFSGMGASKKESLDHPNDKNYGWSSKKGAKGIIKKVGYLCVIAVAMVLDYIILNIANVIGLEVPTTAFFAILVTVWYVLNELLSIIENAGRMGAPIPEWLGKYIAVLKNKIDDNGNTETKGE